MAVACIGRVPGVGAAGRQTARQGPQGLTGAAAGAVAVHRPFQGLFRHHNPDDRPRPPGLPVPRAVLGDAQREQGIADGQAVLPDLAELTVATQ